MKFSVIIPCYNAAPWIAQALRSVASQTYPAHEIIVIDDGSIDDSLEQIHSSGIPVRLLQTRRANGAGARNAGIQVATGDWIALLDADDVWYDNHLARAVELLSGTDDVAFMSTHDWIDLDGRVIAIPSGFKVLLDKPRSSLSSDEFMNLMSNGLHFGHSTVCYRRDRLMEVGCFDTNQVRRHDIDLWLRMILGKHWSFDTVKQAGYRVDTPGSISKNLVNCEYYYLRALLKNSEGYRSQEMQLLIETSARRAMGLAFVNGTPQDVKGVTELGWPYLKPEFRFFYRVTALCPPVFRWILRLRRRIIWGTATGEVSA
jgi:glycosyltransferase involved in cell wall biosynthesis